jgi:capsular exopolysaccharide synthesis family protein
MQSNQSNQNNVNPNLSSLLEDSDLKLTDYISILLRYKWIIIFSFLLVLAFNKYQVSQMPRIYKSTSKILLEDTSNARFILGSEASRINSSLNNNIEILRSRPVLTIAYEILKEEQDFNLLPISRSTDPVSVLKNGVQVSSQRDADILTIGYESTSPRECQAVADAAAQALMEQNTNYARLELRNTREFLSEQLEEAERRLRISEEDLRIFKIENGISLLSAEASNLISRAASLETMQSETQIDLQVKNNHLQYLSSELSHQDTMLLDINNVLTSPLLNKLRSEIVDNQTRYVRLLTMPEYNEDHPELVSLKGKIDSSKKSLTREIKNVISDKSASSDPLALRASLMNDISTTRLDINILKAKLESLKEAINIYNSKLSVLPDTEIQLARLERTNSINEETYSMLVSKFEDAKIAERSKIGNVRILERAYLPGYPIKPDEKKKMMTAALIGLAIGIGLALLLNTLDPKIRTFEDVRRNVKLPIAGTIPHVYVHDNDLDTIEHEMEMATDKEKFELENLLHQIEGRLISNYAPKSSTSESFRILRTNIVAKKQTGKALSLIITSSGPKEGKSTIIANLAITLGQLGDKVILVDLDLRRPMIHNLFNFDKEEGISDFISDTPLEYKKYIKRGFAHNLDIITSGLIPPNPSELLASQNMNILLEELRKHYDYILIDSPPAIAVTDSMVLATKVDLMLLVVRVGRADKEVIRRTKEMLHNINVEIDAAVINDIKPHKYYSSYEYNYYYLYYYGRRSNEKNSKV